MHTSQAIISGNTQIILEGLQSIDTPQNMAEYIMQVQSMVIGYVEASESIPNNLSTLMNILNTLRDAFLSSAIAKNNLPANKGRRVGKYRSIRRKK